VIVHRSLQREQAIPDIESDDEQKDGDAGERQKQPTEGESDVAHHMSARIHLDCIGVEGGETSAVGEVEKRPKSLAAVQEIVQVGECLLLGGRIDYGRL